MSVSWVIFSAVLFQIVWSYEFPYQVPEPLVEVFSPKGLRISIPDSQNVESVEFILTLPRTHEVLVQKVESPEQGHWMYWNPEVTIGQYESLHYKVMVKHSGLYWKKEGVYVNEKVTPSGGQPTNDPYNDIAQGQEIISRFPSIEQANQLARMIASGQSSKYKTFYSMHTDPGLNPITKSTKSTASGTFYVKPSGEVEAVGYKTQSSFDSSKNEGEQWNHTRAQLTPEELESMRRMHERGFQGFHDLTSKLFPNIIHSIEQKEIPIKGHHQFQESHESSYSQSGNPTSYHQYGDSKSGDLATSASEHQTRKSYKMESANEMRDVLQSRGTDYRNSDYARDGYRYRESSYDNYNGNGHFGSSNQMRIDENRQEARSSSYQESIFTPLNTHEKCVWSSHMTVPLPENRRDLEKLVYELNCKVSLLTERLNSQNSAWQLQQDQLQQVVSRMKALMP